MLKPNVCLVVQPIGLTRSRKREASSTSMTSMFIFRNCVRAIRPEMQLSSILAPHPPIDPHALPKFFTFAAANPIGRRTVTRLQTG